MGVPLVGVTVATVRPGHRTTNLGFRYERGRYTTALSSLLLTGTQLKCSGESIGDTSLLVRPAVIDGVHSEGEGVLLSEELGGR